MFKHQRINVYPYQVKCECVIKEKVKGRVLLVDGNGRMVKFLRMNLENSGYEVAVVNDIHAAEESAPTINVDIVALASSVFSDDGEAVARLRKALACPVLVYGLGSYTDEQKKRLNANHYIDRFTEPEEFIRAIETAMTGKA